MLKCEKAFLSLSVVQAQVQKTWFIEEALYLELESSQSRKVKVKAMKQRTDGRLESVANRLLLLTIRRLKSNYWTGLEKVSMFVYSKYTVVRQLTTPSS